ncbi:hypothetical protein HYPSUDRAFT_1092898 [Hypholoma sublateritium FD-334 SS-4]|uniref:Sfi1 spindle body domain-containing protein n=1 Tax=Hypholoma sublateritium (strain FD-334 SS-4) TaxID=945553 RepID=A0A0D2NUM9_HYPSF|nr:hypothetical protein HYPSUDRAFT_1092898 [Hypholoma sublateritium FD-334 SS-4]
MHRFQPARASSPGRAHAHDSSAITDITQSANSTVAPELQHLSADDVDILDAVIKRAGPSATTFFTIFKAYSDVLNDRGLDPQEVVYYGKLLKLGTLKGKNWGDKWEMVKAQLVQNVTVNPTLKSLQAESGYRPYPPSESGLSDDQYSSVSQAHVPKRYAGPPSSKLADVRRLKSIFHSPKPVEVAEKKAMRHTNFSLDATEFPILASIAQRTNMIKHSSPSPNSEEDGATSSPVPPSYKSTVFDLTPPIPIRHRSARSERPILPPTFTAHQRPIPSAPREKARVVDLDDAWKNVKMEQDEKFADKFREDMLLARCWEMWRQGFLWITTTHQQIGEARDKLLLRLSIQRWQTQLTVRRNRESDMVKRFDVYRSRIFWGAWQAKLKQRRQIAWRNDMRQKLRAMKSKTDARLVSAAWKKWRQLYLGHHAGFHYQANLMHRCLSRWKHRLLHADDMQNLAIQFSDGTQFARLRRSWIAWINAIGMRRDERVMVERVNSRIVANSLDIWRKRMEIVKVANRFRDQMIMKHSLRKWKASQRSLRVLESRAKKHLLRQDEFLLRAIVRIWRARMRGKRLEQFKTVLVLKKAWRSWRARVESHHANLALSNKFLQQIDARLAASALTRWRQVLTTHRNAHQYAVDFNATHLRSRALLLWRLRLRDSHQSAKVARWANRFFATRKAWKVWLTAMEEGKRQEKLRQWDISKSRKILNVWRHRAKEGQYFRQCEAIIRGGVKRRIISHTLAKWTNRVIELKSRELDLVHRYDISLMKSAFVKWKISHRQNIEAASLLENYLLVKQEDVLRRAFQRWLTAKRAAEHRRINHERKEAHLRQVAITSAWERWRERFKEEKLRPLEYELILADQRNVLSWAFTIWLSKTFSLPAVRFHSKHIKHNFFQKWRNAMPNALRVKKARETDRFNTIVRTFEKWMQAYKTKITLKAVARAKSLRLPSTSPRQIIAKSRPLYAAPQSIYTRRAQSIQDDDSQVEDASLTDPHKSSARLQLRSVKPRSARSPARSEYAESSHHQNDNVNHAKISFVPRIEFIKSKPRSERSLPRSDYGMTGTRLPSPVRSIVSMPDRNSRTQQAVSSVDPDFNPGQTAIPGTLWTVIKDLPQRRSRNL